MRFASPEAFILFLLIPLYIYFYRESKEKKGLPFPGVSLIKGLKSSYKTFLFKSLFPFRLLILILLIFSLARLQAGYEKTEVKVKGIDIMLAIDTSKSMLAQDLLPKNRMQATKNVIADFIKLQQGNRIGMVVFSGKSFTLSPLTLDYELLLDLLNEVSVNSVKIDGTAIGEAIANSLYRFNYESKERSRVIILLTDGENNSGKIEPRKAAEMAAIKGVKIYAVGAGKTEGAPIPLTNPYTGDVEYARDLNGDILLSKVNEADLIDIAKTTGGEYFRANDTRTLQDIYKKISQLEKSEIETQTIKGYSEKMDYFLIPAFILILLEFLLRKIILNPVKL
jgi:Ca-activated chloride channel family protein